VTVTGVPPAEAGPAPGGRPEGRSLRASALLRLGLVGQVLTFAAMVVPIVLRETEQVLVLVFASAVTVLLTNAALLGYPFVYPVVRGPRMARVATVWSLGTLAVGAAAVLPFTALESPLGLPAGTFAAAAALTAGLGVYDLMVTRLVRAGDTTGMGLARLYYGVLVLGATLAASLGSWGPLGLTLGTSLAYVGTAAALAVRPQHRGPRLPRASRAVRRRLRRAYWARASHATVASLAGGWTMFLPGLTLPALGWAAEAWAVVSRICGGFATVLYTLVAPPVEARLSRAIRRRDRAAFATTRRAGLLASGGVATVAVLSAVALAAYATGSFSWTVALATALFWGMVLAATTIDRVPNFLGRDALRLAWDAGRAVLVSLAFVAVEGVDRLLAMGVVLTVAGLLLLPMTRWRAATR
jgi:hypothetical protein